MESRESQSTAEQAVLRATRALLHVEGPRDVREVTVALVNDLGGDVVEAADDPADAVPLDVSFGVGPPLLARPASGVSRMLLERFLPGFVEDGTRAIALVRTPDRLATEPHPDQPGAEIRGEASDAFVAFSELVVATEGRDVLIDAFRARLRAVESAPGFQRLEVWADQSDPSAFTMVSWWDTKEQFLAYMRSDRHHESHDRIPDGDHAPRPARFRRFRVVAT